MATSKLKSCDLFTGLDWNLFFPLVAFLIRPSQKHSDMAFFGLTNLGYQDPIGDNLLVNPKKVCQGKTGWIPQPHANYEPVLRLLGKRLNLSSPNHQATKSSGFSTEHLTILPHSDSCN